MTPLVVALNLSLCFCGLALMALSLDRHHRDVFGARVPAGRALPLRLGGWIAILGSLAAAMLVEGANFGPIQWIGALTGAGLAVVLILSYRPAWLRFAVFASLPMAALSLLLSLQS
ncbi:MULTISPECIES: DUF3325 domain-containing protein [Methylobacterium]|uniref:DUF3325 domain-containing protein n=1 Tax=Methylobacterium jeotgali TaxID=381630 RepID=A0ABQ4SU58_9HYPH|nr:MULTISPECIES: DUF3325 domain-containing protein [Methylobacterium]PIU04848.1 MAG: DUF3325 domain-containing protein [Methylobacterium sp. CG09_land_8_20_14_0_10_71_15]PIU16060.1 MAG: DUF3325 domain-containing protein [Methylobacterium sp. CG08_land_8_20_14_0_20_71_15]GBU18684.1 hypothetical protein AwMethylo_28990 [Methylobacterium sp.]GJE05983.1 hypothetical protein AOPFMNJM_1289 [Methylobacterium jeotgali]